MTREELRVGQILYDEKENCHLVYSINDSRNSAYCLDNKFRKTSIGLDFLNNFHVYDEIDLELLISELRGEWKRRRTSGIKTVKIYEIKDLALAAKYFEGGFEGHEVNMNPECAKEIAAQCIRDEIKRREKLEFPPNEAAKIRRDGFYEGWVEGTRCLLDVFSKWLHD